MAKPNTTGASLPNPFGISDVGKPAVLFESGGVVHDWEPLGTWLQRRTLGVVLTCQVATLPLLAILALVGVGWAELVAVGIPSQIPLLAVIQRTFRPRRTVYSSSSRRMRIADLRNSRRTRRERQRPK